MVVLLSTPTVRRVSGDPGAAAAVRAELDQRAGDAPRAGGLADQFGRAGTDLRVSLTDKCNLRCTYCMPAEGMAWMPQSSLLTPDEVRRIVNIAVGLLGVQELRLTGGEPLVRPDLEDIVAAVRADHPDLPISITTNGIGLDKRAQGLADAGLSRINVSLDTIDAETYARLSRRDRLARVLKGIAGAREAGLEPIKINAVLMRGVNDAQAPDLLEYCLAHDLQLRFIEQMPLDGDHGWTREDMVTAAEVRKSLERHWRLEPDDVPRGSAPAQRWRVFPRGSARDDEGSGNATVISAAPAAPAAPAQPLGRVGIIASVTEPFCSACSRTRITAEGKIRSCLFSHEEFDLAAVLRADTDDAVVARTWRQAMWLKPAAHGMGHPGLDSEDFVQPERSMSAIGG